MFCSRGSHQGKFAEIIAHCQKERFEKLLNNKFTFKNDNYSVLNNLTKQLMINVFKQSTQVYFRGKFKLLLHFFQILNV
jgi:hypothetical protein